MSVLIEIGNALEKGKKKLVVQYVQQALEEGFSAQDILTEGLLPGMDRVGVKFRANEIFVPEVLVAARAMNAGAALLNPCWRKRERRAWARWCWAPSRETCTTSERTWSR